MNSKQKKILFLPIILLVILFILAFNSHKIKFLMDMVKIYNNTDKGTTIVDKGSEEVTPLPIENPLELIIKENTNHSPVKNMDKSKDIGKTHSNIVTKPDDSVNKSNSSTANENKNTIDNIKKPIKDYNTIIEEYNDVLVNLQANFQAHLDVMVKAGIVDYNSGMSYSKMFSKYLDYGANLEKNSDTEFNSIIKNMEKELTANGHSTSIINDLDAYYKSAKKTIKNEIINRGMKHF